jgi:hypothetical protein
MTALRDANLLRRELLGLSDAELRRRRRLAKQELAALDAEEKRRRERRKREDLQTTRMRAPVR